VRNFAECIRNQRVQFRSLLPQPEFTPAARLEGREVVLGVAPLAFLSPDKIPDNKISLLLSYWKP